jgi:hypothetical protein
MAADVSHTRQQRFTPRNLPLVTSVRGSVNPGAMVRLEGLGTLKKKSMTPSEIEPKTFRLVVKGLNYLCYN